MARSGDGARERSWWDNGGFLFGVNYREIEGASSNADASQWTVFSGIILKF